MVLYLVRKDYSKAQHVFNNDICHWTLAIETLVVEYQNLFALVPLNNLLFTHYRKSG